MTLKDMLFKDEDGEGVKSPCDYIHIKILRFTLLFISSWPMKELGEPQPYYQKTFLKYVYLFITVIGIIAAYQFVVLHFRELNFMELGHMYIMIMMNAVNISRIVTLSFSTKYHNVAKEFLTTIHLFYFKERSEFAMKTHKMVHRLSHLFSLFLFWQMVVGVCFFNLIPMYNNLSAGRYKKGGLQNSTFEHALYYEYPFNFLTDVKGYIVANLIHWCLSFLSATWFCMFDLILSLMVFTLWGHFKILINSLNEFPRPASNSKHILENGFVVQAEKYTKEELLQVTEKLKECIQYHLKLVQFTDTMSDAFGPMLFIYYAFHQASGCLLLLECSEMTAAALMRYVPLTIILFQQLIQLSVIFELVGSESGKLKDAVYGVPWESMDVPNRRILSIFLMNAQEPVHIKALGLANVGVTSMAAILKTSMSYFTFLRSM
uniref:Odorant receptor n=1 Tax=Athetis lepigone TaxID=1223490 RepID=A0A1B3B716_ATHLE|nr:putative odorant receptor OR4 [Athetis lepigone]